MKYSAAVFDLDGTLVDNIPFHFEAWLVMGRKLGVEITHQQFEREFSGRKNDEILPALLSRTMSQAEISAVSEEKEALYRELYAPKMKPLRGALELLQKFKSSGYKLAVASAAPAKNRQLVLDGLQLRSYFDAVVGGEDAARGKPHPDIFLAAAKKLGVEPSKCLAFEDAVLGVRSARAAGMDTAAVTTTTTAEDLRAAGAQWTGKDLSDFPAKLLSQL